MFLSSGRECASDEDNENCCIPYHRGNQVLIAGIGGESDEYDEQLNEQHGCQETVVVALNE